MPFSLHEGSAETRERKKKREEVTGSTGAKSELRQPEVFPQYRYAISMCVAFANVRSYCPRARPAASRPLALVPIAKITSRPYGEMKHSPGRKCCIFLMRKQCGRILSNPHGGSDMPFVWLMGFRMRRQPLGCRTPSVYAACTHEPPGQPCPFDESGKVKRVVRSSS